METRVQGNLVDVHSGTIYPAEILIEREEIKGINPLKGNVDKFILPGFVDAHVHVESSLLIPERFAEIALRHGTVATVSDPHEIANVSGVDGVMFMIRNGLGSKLKFYWTVPSCVPATSFETSGASLGVDEIASLLQEKNIVALGEMMNYPGVVFKDPAVLSKISAASILEKPVDGHAPGLKGGDLVEYVNAGISTDHECATLEEALEKISLGMKILIREGSSAKNFNALFPLLNSNPEHTMLCSDDLHADDLLKGHINLLVKRAVQNGAPLFNVLRSVSLNPVLHYNLPVGLLRVGDSADFLIVDNLNDFTILENWINGELVFKKDDKSPSVSSSKVNINKFNASFLRIGDLDLKPKSDKVRIITVEEGSLLTGSEVLTVNKDFDVFLKENEILRLVVKDRYLDSLPSQALVRGFGSLKGAIASTVAHDSHNLIAVGNNNSDLVSAMNLLIESRGGISFVSRDIQEILPLPVGGLMSDREANYVAHQYEKILQLVWEHGCILRSPLMTLSFLALPVIPSLKLTDKGLFDVDTFSFTNLFI